MVGTGGSSSRPSSAAASSSDQPHALDRPRRPARPSLRRTRRPGRSTPSVHGLDQVRRGCPRRRQREQYTEPYDRLRRRQPGPRCQAGDRHDLRRPRHRRPAGHQGRDRRGHRRPPRRPLQRDAACARVARRGDLPAHARTTSWTTTARAPAPGKEVTALVDSRELWFVCVNNPDGYEYTFTPGNRLWRKNLRRQRQRRRDRRNATASTPTATSRSHWGHDNDGSSPDPFSETYRGPAAASEPETKAMEALFAEIHPVFQKNDHTAARTAALPAGLPAGHADPPTTRSSPPWPAIRTSRHRGLPARAVGGPVRHERRLHRLGLQPRRAASPSRRRAPWPRTRA